jgi:hypothetical protein
MQTSTCSRPDTGTFQQQPKGSSLFACLLLSASDEEHRRAFQNWLRLNLELQLADLEDFLSSLPEQQRIQLETQLADGPCDDLVPQDAPAPHRLLFLSDLETVLTLRRLC